MVSVSEEEVKPYEGVELNKVMREE